MYIWNQFYQTASGNRHSLKLPKCLIAVLKKLSCYLLQLSARFRSLFDNAGLRLCDVVAGRLSVPVSERVALLRYI